MNEIINTDDEITVTIERGGSLSESVNATGIYTATCYDKSGNLKWESRFDNTVTTQGKNHLLDTYLAGSTYTAKVFLGLISSAGYSGVAAGDTANSHAGWTEFTSYSQSTRRPPSFSAASSGSKATSTATAFSIDGSGTVKGAFLMANTGTGSAATKSGFSGSLYSAGLFTVGDKSVTSGDTINVTYTASV